MTFIFDLLPTALMLIGVWTSVSYFTPQELPGEAQFCSKPKQEIVAEAEEQKPAVEITKKQQLAPRKSVFGR